MLIPIFKVLTVAKYNIIFLFPQNVIRDNIKNVKKRSQKKNKMITIFTSVVNLSILKRKM